jgi:pilus assembly protein CpaF
LITTLTLVPGGNETRHPDYQALKGRIHQELLNRLNLDRLGKVKREEAEPELRTLILGILESEQRTTPLSLSEREAFIVDILHELFGLGPLEVLLADPSISDILVNRFDQVYIEREGRLETTEIVFRDDRHLYRSSNASSARSAVASTSRAPWWMRG